MLIEHLFVFSGKEDALIPIVCVDDRYGIAFNHRRQSRDRILYADVLKLCGTGGLWLPPYSRELFSATAPEQLRVDEAFLDRAGAGEYCFAECSPLMPYAQRMEGMVLYRWNRCYPADRYLDLRPEKMAWKLLERVDFAGSSHKKITREVYGR